MITHHRRRILVFAAISIILLTASCREPGQDDQMRLFDLLNRQSIADAAAVKALRSARIVLVGEHHTDPAHHAAQLKVIQMLSTQSRPLSIGLEMFPKDSQAALDQWVAGEMEEAAFEKIYLANWNFPWSLYREIFIYARDRQIPMVGLNVSRGITRQVAERGFASLSDQQRGDLAGVTCDVTREYRDFIRSAFGAHGHGNMDFNRFCEAQLVWDTAMAINSLNHLERHPDRTMVLLAGSGHARKMGIPYQIKSRTTMPVSVLLPYTPGIFEPGTLTGDDADFIIMP
ncbi:ChaN family lipoprotein [Desulfosarcina sp.]|uniref:ChaN family lipoprotein n=1 Tax=Desulfosarcina sp. TaxID=2027861 RepID=UPI00397048BF